MGKKVDASHEFEQYEDFTIEDCHNEQTRLIQNISNLDKDRKTWLAANKGAKDDCNKNLRHINWRIRYLQSGSQMKFYEYMNDCIRSQEEESRKRLFPKKVEVVVTGK